MTSWAGIVAARARASQGLLLTLLCLVAVTTAIIAGTVGYSQAAATTAARGAQTQGEPTEAGVQVQTRLAVDDPTTQDRLARQAILDAFAPAPVTVGRLVLSEPRPVSSGGSPLDGRVVLLGSPELEAGAEGLAGRVTVVEGAWPQGGQVPQDAAAPGALHVGAASAWGVGVGDVLTVDDRAVEVVATWSPVDPEAAFWFGDDLVRSGQQEADHGPLVVAEDLVRQVGDPFVRWPVQPDPSSITPDDLAGLSSSAEELREDLRDVQGVSVRGITVDGDLAPTAATAATNLATARALGVIPLSVLVLVTGLAVVQLARLLTSTREPQVQLLVARGAGRGQVLATGLVESAAVAVVGATLGGLLARAGMQLVPGGELVGTSVLAVTGLVLLGILVVLAVVAVGQARRLAGGRSGADLSGRARAATALATVVLVLGAAALSWWQLRRAGSPLVARPDGALATDLVAGAAPALLLAASAVVALALLGPLTRALELATRPARTATGHLASAQVSRHLSVYAVPVVLTVLAVGATTLAALYAGTSAQLREDLGAVSRGAPVRADVVRPLVQDTPGVVPPAAPDVTTDPSVTGAALVWLEPNARVGDLQVPLVLGSSGALRAVTPAVADESLVPDGLDQLLDPDGTPLPDGSVAVPPGTAELEVRIEAELDLDAWQLSRLDSLAPSLLERRERLDELGIDLSGGLPPDSVPTPEEEARAALDQEVAALRAGREVTVSVLVRDTDSGLTHLLRTQPLPTTGPEVTYDEDTLSGAAATPGTTTGGLGIPLDPERSWALESVVLDVSGAGPGVTLALDVAVRADGRDLLDGSDAWGSTDAATPEQAAPARAEAEAVADPYARIVWEVFGDSTTWSMSQGEESNRPFIPPVLDTSSSTWRLEVVTRGGPLGAPDLQGQTGLQFVVAPGLTWVEDRGLALDAAPTAPTPTARVPVALTAAAADAAALRPGDDFELAYAGGLVPARLTTLVPAVPGQTGELGALADSRVLARALVADQRTLPWPSQVWATPAGDPQAAVAALSTREDLRGATGPGAVAVTDATSAARLVFWVASAGAVLLALTGIAAVAATLLSARRPEVAVLRALGMPPAAQARSRALELAGVVLAAVAFGLLAGWLVGTAVVPELASTSIRPGGLSLPTRLRLEATPWLVLVGAGGVLVLALTLVLAARVRRQALDRSYREEIR
ncbi:FtsX-like permease family protein [Ornithinimicrobium flavum]|uniref:FtsX-like permease family protein n=1 Tax=Ornithinimicrobium flavum TaxID=1288636 RepID=UPI0010705E77|nr:FtsX-like permease family protein [Ornithinimicrobium flavum]